MKLSRRALLFGGASVLAGGAMLLRKHFRKPFPSDTTPIGAYLRIAQAVTQDNPKAFFAYLETEAQWACYTLRDARKEARERILASYPEPKRTELGAAYADIAQAADGSDVFALLYQTRQWSRRLRRDLSGASREEFDEKGERASVVTVRGTRWPFRKRDNGIWGLTIFTAELLAEAEKATRDKAIVLAAAADYEKLRRLP
jgi:hypothetical protein